MAQKGIHTTKKVKRHLEWENMFANPVFGQNLKFSIYIKNSSNSVIKR